MSIPLRLRILAVLLLSVTTAVGVITFVMAREFQQDKRTYLNDLTTVTALSAAEECRSLLIGYEERARVYGRILASPDLTRARRIELLEPLFTDFRDLVGISVIAGDQEPISVFDTVTLERAGVESRDLLAHVEDRLPPRDRLRGGRIFVENSSVSPALPTLTLAIPLEPQGSETIVIAVLHLGGLQRLAGRPGVFETLLVDASGTLLAHPDASRSPRRDSFRIPAQAEHLRGAHSAGVTVEFEDDGTPMIGGYASARFGGVLAGVQIPLSAAYVASRQLLTRLLWVALVLLLVAAVVGILGSHEITRPLARLANATTEIAKGRFDVEVDIRSRDEIGTLASSFRRMGSELQAREAELQAAHDALVQSEKMAAFGQLGAGIAHEVKNPLAGILGCAQLSLREVPEGSALRQNLNLIEKESRRCKTILENLLRFARQEKALLGPTQVNPVVQDAIAIVRHQLELNQVKLEFKEGRNLPVITGNANQLQQVILNLVMNAQQAMDRQPGVVTVSTGRTRAGDVEIRVQDDGPGIPSEVQKRIFEPFYTTKPSGKGTGLGLSVSYGIVREHGGEIEVSSIPGVGTEFTMTFPALAGTDSGTDSGAGEAADEPAGADDEPVGTAGPEPGPEPGPAPAGPSVRRGRASRKNVRPT